MDKLIFFKEKIIHIYKNGGVMGLVGFLGWLFHLGMEKLLFGVQEKMNPRGYKLLFPQLNKPLRMFSSNPTEIKGPVITFVIPVKNEINRLATTIRSLQMQTNPFWECLICLENDSQNATQQAGYRISDERIKCIDIQEIKNIDQLMSAIIPHAHGKWVVISRPGDRHVPSLVESILTQSGSIVYWDEACYRGWIAYDPFLKPDWSPETWLSVDLLRCAAYNTETVCSFAQHKKLGFIALLIARETLIVHIPRILTYCRNTAWEDPHIVDNHIQNVTEYLKAIRLRNPVIEFREGKRLFISFKPESGLVSIIIPTKDNPELVQKCLSSIQNFQTDTTVELILVDNQSKEKSTYDYYHKLKKENRSVRIIDYGPDFNFSRACNLGASESRGKYLLFLNNDIEVITPHWLTNMLSFISIEGVGIVGAKLIYPDGRIQHAGIVLGMEGHASHVFMGNTGKSTTPFGSIAWYRNYSAVTAACMLVRRDVFKKINGFDEKFRLIFNDVDLCLRAEKKGYRTVYNPDVVLIHHEGKTRGRFNPESDIKLAFDRFYNYIDKGDPFYNPGLSRAYRMPVLRKKWEQEPNKRIKDIIKYEWY